MEVAGPLSDVVLGSRRLPRAMAHGFPGGMHAFMFALAAAGPSEYKASSVGLENPRRVDIFSEAVRGIDIGF